MKGRLLFSFFLSLFTASIGHAQSLEERMNQKNPTCSDVFLNAMNIMPQLYRHQLFDSLHTALAVWRKSCGDIPEVGCTELLLSIEESTFDERRMDSSTVDLLVNYSYSLHHSKMRGIPREETSFFTLISSWATLLLKEKHLNDSEKFICRVFAGDIDNPVKEIRKNTMMYPAFAQTLRANETAQRTGFRTNYAFLGGIWIPMGDLSVLGDHPSLGFQFGGRDNSNQLDFTLQIRFLNSANTYTIQRNNGYYDLTNYFGGYVGVDYTRYFVNKLNFDLGLFGGMGYDGFDLTNSKENYDELKPLSIGSFNANAGFKLNYYLTSTFYVGLQARYNLINYVNHGGTSMAGDAFSIDLIIGGNKKVNR